MSTINLPFAASATRRAPSAELESGYPCGPLDRDLDNWLEWWVTGQIAAAIDAGGLSVDDTDLLRLAKVIQSGKSTYAVATGTANAWTVAPNLAVPAYAAGRVLNIIAPATNTSTTVNMNVSTLGNCRIKKRDGTDPSIGDLVGGIAYPTIDDGTNIRVLTALPSEIAVRGAPGRSRDIYAASTTWVVPAGVTVIRASVWGGGGGGGFAAAGGGGGGAFSIGNFAVTPGATLNITVGAGGTAGASGVAATNGGLSRVAVNGGATLLTANGGVAANNASSSSVSSGASGGSASGGSLNIAGQTGGGGTIIGSFLQAGAGGSSPTGGFGGRETQSAAQPGSVPGGGGSGGLAVGNGAAGVVIIEY